jgi:hypothetical protein
MPAQAYGQPRARQVYRDRMRDLIARIRAQREEEAKFGLPEIERRWNVVADPRVTCEQEIEAVDPSPGKAGALMLVSVNFQSRRDSSLDRPGTALATAADALRALRPSVTGILGAQVDHLLEHPAMALAEMPFWAE